VSLQTKPTACMNCHGMINPLGFTLEHFDAVGRYRELEKGAPVDSSGGYRTPSGETVQFSGVRDLAKYLAGSEEVQTAFAERMFHHLIQHPVQAYGADCASQLRGVFAANNFSIRKLAVEILVIAAMKPREGAISKSASGPVAASGAKK
jgi:hypothetical protein